MAVVEQIAGRQTAAHLRYLEGGASLIADVAEGSIPLIQEKQLWLAIAGSDVPCIHLGIHVAVDKDYVRPAIVRQIHKGIAPANIRRSGRGNSRRSRDIGEGHGAVVAI